MTTGPTEDVLVIADADGTNPRRYTLAPTAPDGGSAWNEHSESATGREIGEKIERTWEFYPAGMGEERDVGEGGYHFAKNFYFGRPGRVLPCPTVTTVTLTGNTMPVEHMFEGVNAAGNKFLYCLAGTKAFKVNINSKTLVNTRELATAEVYFATGSYVGTGEARSITGVGFPPDCVMIKGDGGVTAYIRVTGMTANTSKLWTGETSTTALKSLDEDGFTLGIQAVNVVGVTYHWMAWKESAGYVDVGTYTGDGSNDASKHIHTVGFQADLVWIWDAASAADTAEVVSRHSTHGANESVSYHDGTTYADCVSAFLADGFSLKGNTRVNASGHTYWYVAFKALANHFKVDDYAGTGLDQNITGVGFDPSYVIASRYGTSTSVHRSNTCSGDSTMNFSVTPNAADRIEELITDGLNLGTNAQVNANGVTYHYAAWVPMDGGTPVFGKVAEWYGSYEIPCGNDMDWLGLTVITDDTADDTYAVRTALKAQHFCVVENEIYRAFADRTIQKCSADAVATAGNWSGTYYVGLPGEVITNLLDVNGEVGVCTDRNFYLFDRVATARAQLNMAKVIADQDNGKGALQWGDLTLLPYGELWRYSNGGVMPIGVDTIPLNKPVAGISNEPCGGRYGGLASLEGWIYAAYGLNSTTNTYILYTHADVRTGKVPGDVWDCLYYSATTTTPDVLFIDSERNLWFNLGNDIAYISLSRGGAPEGGTFGNTAPAWLFLPEINTGGNTIQLQEVEVETRLTDAAFTWYVYVYRDGDGGSLVGDGWTAAGRTYRYFTLLTNDTCRSARIAIAVSSAAYTPSVSPPELRRVTLRGEVRPQSSEDIYITIQLEDGGRTSRAKHADLKTLVEAGVKRIVNHPVSKGTVYVTVLDVKEDLVNQKGSAKPVSVAVLRLRRAPYV
jgi:hypothetical protein